MPRKCRFVPVFAFCLFLSAFMMGAGPARAQQAEPGEGEPESSRKYHGYEAVIGVTSRAQNLIVFEGRGDKRLATMTGSFAPSPQIFLNTPFRPFRTEDAGEGNITRTGYYIKYSYNSFSLDRQEDPDTGGIGPGSDRYNYGTEVKGHFFAVAPVGAVETIRPDGSVPFRIEFGIGLGYLDLSGDVVLGDWLGDPMAPKTPIDYSGLSYFFFAMGRHQFGSFMFGYQMGINATSSRPYSFSQGYVSLDLGYKVAF